MGSGALSGSCWNQVELWRHPGGIAERLRGVGLSHTHIRIGAQKSFYYSYFQAFYFFEHIKCTFYILVTVLPEVFVCLVLWLFVSAGSCLWCLVPLCILNLLPDLKVDSSRENLFAPVK